MTNSLLTTFKYLMLGCAIGSTCATAASAQVKEPSPPTATNAFDAESGPGFLLPGLQATADVDGGKTVKLTFASTSDNRDTVGETGFSFTLSGTFDKEAGRGALITQRGLTSGFNAEFSLSGIIAAGVEPPRPGEPEAFLTPDLFLWTVTAGVGYENFEYRLPTSFATEEQDELSYSVSGSIAVVPNSGAVLLGAGLEHRRYFEAPAKRILCPPAPPGGPVECTQAVFSPPQEKRDTSLFGVLRALAPFGAAVPAAAELRVAFDIEDGTVGVEVPVYFFLDAKKQYRGGVQVGWDSEEEDVRVGLFVGLALDFLKL